MTLDRLSVMLVDDEPLALEYLKAVVESFPGFVVKQTCRNGREALKALQENHFDALFLDIQMPGMTGFDVVESIQMDLLPAVVFATAYDEFACRAFDLHAVDYILKPLDPERVEVALQRVQQRLSGRQAETRNGALYAAIRALSKDEASANFEQEIVKISIKDGGTTTLVPVESVNWIDAAGDYMCVHTADKTHIMRSTMSRLLNKLPSQFVRIHRSTIVNQDKITAVRSLPKGETVIELQCGTEVRGSRNYKETIQSLIGEQ